MTDTKRYYGKYRATVLNNIDPMQMARIQAIVPDALGIIPSSWAMPCLPLAGIQHGMFTVPQIGSGVWIEFEQGDLERPIWTGCYWGSVAEVPVLALQGQGPIQQIVLQTTQQNTVLISDVPGPTGGILLKSTTGALISISDTGIIISNGQGAIITMTGPAVDVNAGALTII